MKTLREIQNRRDEIADQIHLIRKAHGHAFGSRLPEWVKLAREEEVLAILEEHFTPVGDDGTPARAE